MLNQASSGFDQSLLQPRQGPVPKGRGNLGARGCTFGSPPHHALKLHQNGGKKGGGNLGSLYLLSPSTRRRVKREYNHDLKLLGEKIGVHRRRSVYPLTLGIFGFFWQGQPNNFHGHPCVGRQVRKEGHSRQGMPIPITLNVVPVNDNSPQDPQECGLHAFYDT